MEKVSFSWNSGKSALESYKFESFRLELESVGEFKSLKLEIFERLRYPSYTNFI